MGLKLIIATIQGSLEEVRRVLKTGDYDSPLELMRAIESAIESDEKNASLIIKEIINDEPAMKRALQESWKNTPDLLLQAISKDRPHCLKELLDDKRLIENMRWADRGIFKKALSLAERTGATECLGVMLSSRNFDDASHGRALSNYKENELPSKAVNELNALSKSKLRWTIRQIDGQECYVTTQKVENHKGVIFCLNECLESDIPMKNIKGDYYVYVPLKHITEDNLSKIKDFGVKDLLKPSAKEKLR